MNDRGQAAYGENGTIEHVEGVLLDVTPHKQTEEKLLENERMLQSLFDDPFNPIGLLTVEGTVLAANQWALEFAGGLSSRMLSASPSGKRRGGHIPRKCSRSFAMPSRGEPLANLSVTRFTHCDKHGQLHVFDFSLRPVRDAQGKVIFLNPESQDITEPETR